MNGRERIALAMQNKEPDRVPVMCQLALGHYFLNTDIPAREIWFTSEGFAEALVTLQRRYQFDGILINLPGRPEGLLDEVASIEPVAEGEWLTWRNGERTIVPHDDNLHHYLADGGELPRFDFMAMGVDDLDRLDTFT
ncbi:MAG: hypothetical protein GWN58_31050, partial [Anaerolineae bacterium]|nr:hypothetical protein [Anaerolineae bacterium]